MYDVPNEAQPKVFVWFFDVDVEMWDVEIGRMCASSLLLSAEWTTPGDRVRE
jgi:hypothetical protein